MSSHSWTSVMTLPRHLIQTLHRHKFCISKSEFKPSPKPTTALQWTRVQIITSSPIHMLNSKLLMSSYSPAFFPPDPLSYQVLRIWALKYLSNDLFPPILPLLALHGAHTVFYPDYCNRLLTILLLSASLPINPLSFKNPNISGKMTMLRFALKCSNQNKRKYESIGETRLDKCW